MSAALQKSLRHDRALVLSGLFGVVVLAWVYTFYRAGNMQNADMGMAGPRMEIWGATDFVLTFVMWAVMMVAMMIPSASPMVLTYSTLYRRRYEQRSPLVPVSMFLLGYVITWAAFSMLATATQWGFHSAALLSSMMVSTSPILGGVLLLIAGVFQLTPLKHACLRRCRTPLGFLMNEWRDGERGALVMGLRHGVYCVGCCWLLMALLFVAGVMNLLWVAVIAAFVLVEKVAPAGGWVSYTAGVLLVGSGLWMVAGTVLL